ncbi:hypothetical protein [Kosakonia sacchari]|uniref:hypothetical protein n=1 Tax=Kosakonia sacchari TaxID=1158459 RepID=UPI0028AB9002|nr:hypothetical protein [Kosakonia sacchari]
MILGYLKSTDGRVSDEEHRRVVAVDAALEIIKASLATSANSKNIAYDLEQALIFLPQLADKIQETIGQ